MLDRHYSWITSLRGRIASNEALESQFISLSGKQLDDCSSRFRRHAFHALHGIDTAAEQKVGLVGARSRLGQSAQAVGSIALPGDFTNIRRPVRSSVYEAITPGGGTDNNILRRTAGALGRAGREERGYRCPVGYQFGGRFTDENYSTCGMQLFDIPNFLGLSIRDLLGGVGSGAVGRIQRPARVIDGVDAPDVAADIVRGADIPTGDSPLDRARRMASVPEATKDNVRRRSAMAKRVVSIISDDTESRAAIIRRDGVVLTPLLPSGSLRKFSDNPDLQNSVFIRSLRTPNIEKDDIGLLAGTGVREVIFQIPGGTLSLSLQRDLTVGEKRSFGRMLNSAAESADPYDPGKALEEFAGKTNGAVKYVQRLADKKANAIIEVEIDGVNRRVRRWAYEAFYAKK